MSTCALLAVMVYAPPVKGQAYLVRSARVKELIQLGNSSRRENGKMNSPFSHFDDQIVGRETGITERVLGRRRVRSRIANQNAIFMHFALNAGSTIFGREGGRGREKGSKRYMYHHIYHHVYHRPSRTEGVTVDDHTCTRCVGGHRRYNIRRQPTP